MPKTWIVARNELYRYFISPLAYVYLIAFLLLNGSFAVYFGDFFNRGQADLSSMFAFQPWIYLIFIPGISMRLWAEEFRQQTIAAGAGRRLCLGKIFGILAFLRSGSAAHFSFLADSQLARQSG